MIGDDAECGVAGALKAGVGIGFFVRTGQFRAYDEEHYKSRPTFVVSDFQEAVEVILSAGL